MTGAPDVPRIDGFESAWADVDGISLHFWRGGDPDGPPVLLWHGFLGTAYAWRDVMTGLAAAGVHVLAPDMRGYGDSDKPPGTAGYDGRALAAEMRSLVGAIGFGDGRPLTLVAHDMGAPPALLWAAEHPREIVRLVYMEVPVMLADELRDTVSFASEEAAAASMWWWLLPLVPGVPEALIVGGEAALLRWFFDRDARTRAAVGPALDEYLRTFRGEAGVLGALGVYRAAFETMRQTDALRSRPVGVPVVGVGGGASLGASVARALRRVATDVHEVVLEDCGHFVGEERPDAVVALVLDAVRS